MATLQAVSLGCEVDVWSPGSGVVHSVFEHAINFLVDGELFTVLNGPRTDSPFGIRLAPIDTRLNARAADRVSLRAGFVGIGRLVVDCRTALCWGPTRWERPATGLEARLAAIEHAASRRAWVESSAMAGEVTKALRGSDVELGRAVRRTVGRGPGLTPAGDDVLVGMLALFTSGAGGREGERTASRLAGAIDRLLHTTSDLSGRLLRQAARGLPSRALHDLGQALVEGAPRGALMDAIDLALNCGSTSGADACIGLHAACRSTLFNLGRSAE